MQWFTGISVTPKGLKRLTNSGNLLKNNVFFFTLVLCHGLKHRNMWKLVPFLVVGLSNVVNRAKEGRARIFEKPKTGGQVGNTIGSYSLSEILIIMLKKLNSKRKEFSNENRKELLK